MAIFTLLNIRGASAQYAVGDYGSTSTGGWSTAIWSTWNGAIWVATAGTPSQLTNVFILTGTTVTVTASPMTTTTYVLTASSSGFVCSDNDTVVVTAFATVS